MSILACLVLRATDRARWWCVTIAGIAQIAFFRLIPPYSTALFRLIRFTLKLLRCAQKPHGSSTVSARINHAKSFQMKQIVPQSTVGNR